MTVTLVSVTVAARRLRTGPGGAEEMSEIKPTICIYR